MSKECTDIGIPEYLHTKDRSVDSVFNIEEQIFRRFQTAQPINIWLEDSQVSAAIFPLKDDSYNREKYSKAPCDVLYNINAKNKTDHYFNSGIISLTCGQIQNELRFKSIINKEEIEVMFNIIHKPEVCIYPHCEVIALKNGKHINPTKPKSARSVIRDILIEKCIIIKEFDTA